MKTHPHRALVLKPSLYKSILCEVQDSHRQFIEYLTSSKRVDESSNDTVFEMCWEGQTVGFLGLEHIKKGTARIFCGANAVVLQQGIVQSCLELLYQYCFEDLALECVEHAPVDESFVKNILSKFQIKRNLENPKLYLYAKSDWLGMKETLDKIQDNIHVLNHPFTNQAIEMLSSNCASVVTTAQDKHERSPFFHAKWNPDGFECPENDPLADQVEYQELLKHFCQQIYANVEHLGFKQPELPVSIVYVMNRHNVVFSDLPSQEFHKDFNNTSVNAQVAGLLPLNDKEQGWEGGNFEAKLPDCDDVTYQITHRQNQLVLYNNRKVHHRVMEWKCLDKSAKRDICILWMYW
ncbi:MAG: hypothetical protein CMK59_10000 [Proteobacteria bacterium]|nr:hypothetical protein [Pseudomonadota bacterium]